MKNISDENFEIVEVYPYIYVYKNLFKNIDEIYQLIKDSTVPGGDNFFNDWSQWSIFGDYLNPLVHADKFPENTVFHPSDRYKGIEKCVTKTEIQQKQKDFLIALYDNFYASTEDYAKKHGIDIDKKAIVKDENSAEQLLWQVAGPTICKYHISDEANRVGMRYHSDFIREQQHRPGHKFAITALAYFNDDYIGGEIDFAIGKKLVKYKPQAGDYVIFPSGHPEILTEDGEVYLHGVMPAEGTHKYFSRMYWTKFYEGSQEWFDKQNEYGREKWLQMQDELDKQFRDQYPQRTEIEGGIRLQ